MNKYDDIKRFKEKTHMEGIDYKEISDSSQEGAQQNWAILRQLSATAEAPGALGSSQRTVQPAPTPVSDREFATDSLLSTLSDMLPAAPAVAPAAPHTASPAPAAVSPAQPAAAPPAPEAARYTSLFRPKPVAQPAADSRRDTPLQPLLEMIASCR
ncbi:MULTISPECIES: cellulose biosynthesis protein BcsO [Yersiniaceae]|uniref:Cellulose biosynthesis protein BcsO n=1 Tax=Nissabacter archeti TaxID=1917880 RepID=A0ABS5JDE6_9GAMM|nr:MULTISPECIES: cellulose biosynthesis protein BcsO [Yersiniaceae]MBS0967975.1 cellulose biosynthesis protein BcsO [Nissabacter archeti]MDV5140592.1 cellulose biosynthesis protein BcsO [Chimaeribacter arupi]